MVRMIVEIRAVKNLDKEELDYLKNGTESEQQETIKSLEDEFIRYFKGEGAEDVTVSVTFQEP